MHHRYRRHLILPSVCLTLSLMLSGCMADEPVLTENSSTADMSTSTQAVSSDPGSALLADNSSSHTADVPDPQRPDAPSTNPADVSNDISRPGPHAPMMTTVPAVPTPPVQGPSRTQAPSESNVAPTTSSQPTSAPLPDPYANTSGNTTGNIVNGGAAAIQGDWIYYRNNADNGKLYAMKTDGSDWKLLTNQRASNINVSGNWIFYWDFYDTDLYTIHTDGSGKKKLFDENVSDMYFAGDRIFYTRFNWNGTYELCMIKTDGSDIQL